ncbi:hypothetical protein KAR91_76015 [Candidatus Pacearchaeota archaeon]|nr:hypothetical protein [Candidatus Pacearchaeota archaeon]
MSDDELVKLLENEKEWRRFIITEVKEIKKDCNSIRKNMSALKVKVAVVAAGFGATTATLVKLLDKY